MHWKRTGEEFGPRNKMKVRGAWGFEWEEFSHCGKGNGEWKEPGGWSHEA